MVYGVGAHAGKGRDTTGCIQHTVYILTRRDGGEAEGGAKRRRERTRELKLPARKPNQVGLSQHAYDASSTAGCNAGLHGCVSTFGDACKTAVPGASDVQVGKEQCERC